MSDDKEKQIEEAVKYMRIIFEHEGPTSQTEMIDHILTLVESYRDYMDDALENMLVKNLLDAHKFYKENYKLEKREEQFTRTWFELVEIEEQQ